MRFLFSRIPQSLPNLHDEVVAAAANAAISVSSDHKRKQVLKTDTVGFSMFML